MKAVSLEGERIAKLEQDVTDLRNEIATIKEELASFRKQFD
jgi:septal ring factor EnvC (AmiA/AmiB activator)